MRAVVAREKHGSLMTLGNMRKNGIHAVIATCQTCGHKADVNVDALPETIAVPKTGRRLRCSHCGGKQIDSIQSDRNQSGPYRPGASRPIFIFYGFPSSQGRIDLGRKSPAPEGVRPRGCGAPGRGAIK